MNAFKALYRASRLLIRNSPEYRNIWIYFSLLVMGIPTAFLLLGAEGYRAASKESIFGIISAILLLAILEIVALFSSYRKYSQFNGSYRRYGFAVADRTITEGSIYVPNDFKTERFIKVFYVGGRKLFIPQMEFPEGVIEVLLSVDTENVNNWTGTYRYIYKYNGDREPDFGSCSARVHVSSWGGFTEIFFSLDNIWPSGLTASIERWELVKKL